MAFLVIFGRVQNCLRNWTNLENNSSLLRKKKKTKEIKIKDKEQGWRRLTQMTNEELEQFRLSFSSCGNRDVAP